MQIYLPIAEVSVNLIVVLSIGFTMGFFAGIFGVGGGFIGIPLLMLIGVNPAVAVASTTAQMISTGFSNLLIRLRRGHVDFRIGYFCLCGGIFGAFIGSKIFGWLYSLGTIDVVISISYVLILGVVGSLMAIESARMMWRRYAGDTVPVAHNNPTGFAKLKSRIILRDSHDRIHFIMPILLGFAVAIMVAITGVGSGFLTIPAMIYLFGMPTFLAIGTSVFQATFVVIIITLFQIFNNYTVDILLTSILMIAAVMGVQTGARLGNKIPPEELRVALACLMLVVVIRLMFALLIPPEDIYTISRIIHNNY